MPPSPGVCQDRGVIVAVELLLLLLLVPRLLLLLLLLPGDGHRPCVGARPYGEAV